MSHTILDRKVVKPLTEFDVNNVDHCDAVLSTIRNRRLDPRYRFLVKAPFTSALTQALHEMAVKHYKDIKGEVDEKLVLDNVFELCGERSVRHGTHTSA